MGILIPFCIFINILSYGIGYIFKFIHEDSPDLFQASLVAVGSPNSISLPLMVMQALCEESTVNADYDGDSESCYEEATSMMFIYSIGWHLLFWGYGYNVLNKAGLGTTATTPLSTTSHIESMKDFCTNANIRRESFTKFTAWLKGILLTPSMAAIYVGLAVGLIPPLQRMLFEDISPLRPLGGAVSTLGEPVIALNCLVMAASLAHADINISELTSSTRSAASSLRRSVSARALSLFAAPSAPSGKIGADRYDDLSVEEQIENEEGLELGLNVQTTGNPIQGQCVSQHEDKSATELDAASAITPPMDAILRDDNVPYARNRAWSGGSDWCADCEVLSEAVDEALGVSVGMSSEDEDAVAAGNGLDIGDGESVGSHLTSERDMSQHKVLPDGGDSVSVQSRDHGVSSYNSLPQLRSIAFVILCR